MITIIVPNNLVKVILVLLINLSITNENNNHSNPIGILKLNGKFLIAIKPIININDPLIPKIQDSFF